MSVEDHEMSAVQVPDGPSDFAEVEEHGGLPDEASETEQEENDNAADIPADRRTRSSLATMQELSFYLGPGFLISVAYMDPGNWATNISGGATYGTALLWVIVLASIMAMGIQIVAAKLGIATGKDVALLCRESLPKSVVYILWVAAELAMIATDMAEIIGAAIGFQLVCNFPLWAGAVLAGVSSFALLAVRTAFTSGYRVIEFVVMAFVGIIALVFVIELFVAKPSAHLIFSGLKPTIPDTEALYIAIGILGATVMPHSVYLHPDIVQDRRSRLVEEKGNTEDVHRNHLRFESVDTVLALIGAMFVNAAMLIVAATALNGTGIDTVEDAYTTVQDIFGEYASVLFGVALIAAGLSSSLVATMAGQIVMDGFLNWSVNVWIRRSVTLLPSLAIVVVGLEPTKVLVASQVALSFELPFVLIPLVYFTRKPDLMGSFVNSKVTTAVMCIIVGVIVVLNMWLLVSMAIGI
jgi:manganese transport protein